MYRFLSKKIKAFLVKKNNPTLKVGRKTHISLHSKFEGKNVIGDKCDIGDCEVGYASYISSNSSLTYTKIGKYCAIGQNVKTCLGLHPSHTFVSIHPAFFSKAKQSGFTYTDEQLFEEHIFLDTEKRFVVEIGNDVWIGNNVTIMDGVRIGDGAILAANSVVTKDVEPYSIVGGVPAKQIKFRFTNSEIAFLLKFKWWNKSEHWIKENAHLFTNIKQLISNSSEAC